MIPYTPPTFELSAFNCPHCGAYANQYWATGFYGSGGGVTPIKTLKYSHCQHCHSYVFGIIKK